MKLTKFSDYSLRLLLYLALHGDRLVSVREVSRAYRVSSHNMVKIVQLLVEEGLVLSVRGRNGGLKLAVSPEQINIGKLLRRTERNRRLVECFDLETNTCPIESACGLKGALHRAENAFYDSLERQTLADFLPRAPVLIRLLG